MKEERKSYDAKSHFKGLHKKLDQLERKWKKYKKDEDRKGERRE